MKIHLNKRQPDHRKDGIKTNLKRSGVREKTNKMQQLDVYF